MGWSGGWLPLDGEIVGEPSAVSRTAELTHVFARGVDDRLWSRFYAPAQWSNWARIDPSWHLYSSPAATSMGPDRLHIFAQGTNQALESMWWAADSGWHGPQTHGGKIAGAPAAVVRDPNICDVFARAPDDTLWQISLKKDNSVAVDWRQVSTSWKLNSAPSAGSMGEQHVAVFAQGKDQGLESMWWDGGSEWHGPKNYNGKIVGAPSVVCRKSGICDVFARGLTDRLFEISWVNGTKIDWREVPEAANAGDSFLGENHAGNTLTSSPAADTMGPEHVHVFVRGSDGALWQKWWVGGGAPTVHLHFRAITAPSIAQITAMIKNMRQTYAGVWIDVVDFLYLDVPENRPGLLALLDTFNAGTCLMTPPPSGVGIYEPSDDQNALFELGGDLKDKHLVVYFVSTMTKSDGTRLAGCATHPPHRPGAVVTSTAPVFVLGHEVGHVLGLAHADDSGPLRPKRVMSKNGPTQELPGDLLPTEVYAILNNQYLDFV